MIFATGLLIGLVLGLTGAGGSVIAVPLLMGLLGLSLPVSAGLSLGAVGAAALLGVLLRSRSGLIAWSPALWLSLGGIIMVPPGQWLASRLPEAVLVPAFVLLVAVVATRLWRQAGRDPDATREIRASIPENGPARDVSCSQSPSGRFEWRWPCVLRMVVAGALTGLLSGLFGVGGGFVVVPALVLLNGLPMAQAVATSLVIITVVAGSGFANFLWHAVLPWSLLLALTGGSLAGMLLGTALGRKVAGPALQKGFSILMLAMGASMLLHLFR
ncbi:MAG: sulfite exporter TauE/SafE family protein [bacterium]|nr:sulfite exporter TauE/SafE family protein [bacterium]